VNREKLTISAFSSLVYFKESVYRISIKSLLTEKLFGRVSPEFSLEATLEAMPRSCSFIFFFFFFLQRAGVFFSLCPLVPWHEEYNHLSCQLAGLSGTYQTDRSMPLDLHASPAAYVTGVHARMAHAGMPAAVYTRPAAVARRPQPMSRSLVARTHQNHLRVSTPFVDATARPPDDQTTEPRALSSSAGRPSIARSATARPSAGHFFPRRGSSAAAYRPGRLLQHIIRSNGPGGRVRKSK
jgi:hypothetical protein